MESKEIKSSVSSCLSRRDFLRRSAVGAAAVASTAILGINIGKADTLPAMGPAKFVIPLDQDWLFGGKLNVDLLGAKNDEAFSRVTLPHCVTKLSYEDWDPNSWETLWLYRRHFSLPNATAKRRVFVKFDGVSVAAKVTINGATFPEHIGSYLPFEHELTQYLKDDGNVLEVEVDARWQAVPPEGNPKGTHSVDYLQPGGIFRSVKLHVLPPVFIADVFAKPVNVLDEAKRAIEVLCTVNTANLPDKPFAVKVELMEGDKVISSMEQPVKFTDDGNTEVSLSLTNLGKIELWDIDAPKLYTVVTTLTTEGAALHDYRTRIGFREAKFTTDGFFLNGHRLQLFGLDRHEIYPYVGGAMPPRVMRKDAEILRREFNCNIVRCSHYPQAEAFLDACDELGLMVWQEPAGWGYLGDQAWKELVVRDVREMIIRDRNHPAIIIWADRVNESRNDQTLYRKTKAIAKALDDSRPTSGSMTGGSRKNWKTEWHEDVFAFDDYQSGPNGGVAIEKPTVGFPYMLAEAVGQYSYGSKGFRNIYRRAGDLKMQTEQAIFHAEAHEKAAESKGNSGVIAWCAFEYASLMNPFKAVKCPGVADVFRVPKLGATFYLAQVDPKIRAVIAPNFYWDFGAQTPRGPGKNVAIFSNCEMLEIFVGGKSIAKVSPDRARFPHLKCPPFFCDLDIDGGNHPELRIDGYVDGKVALSRSFSSDPEQDKMIVKLDDSELQADGADATRVVFKVTDKYEAERAFAGGEFTFQVNGPIEIVGDNPFLASDSGGVGAVWLKSIPNKAGHATVTISHSTMGKKSVELEIKPQAKS